MSNNFADDLFKGLNDLMGGNINPGNPSTIFDVLKNVDVQKPVKSSIEVQKFEDRSEYSMDMPGVEEKDIDVKTENNVLHIRGVRYARRTIMSDSTRTYSDNDRIGVYEESVKLRDNADPQNITAKYVNGVITVTVPVKEEAKPHTIKVNVE